MTITQEHRNAAAALLETKGWTRMHYAHDAHGRSADPRSPDACEFCVVGALAAAMNEEPGMVHCQHPFEGGSLSVWNDDPERTLGEVTAWLRSGDMKVPPR